MKYFKNPLFIEKKINKLIKNFKYNKKFFCLPMFPYPSGKLHLGHVRNYILTDIISKIKNLEKKNVLHPMGWDSFGLPAENASKKFNLTSLKWTISNIKLMKKQLKIIQINYSKKLEFLTCDINFYKWEFWILLFFYKNKLLFKQYNEVYWDSIQQCILSNEQINNNLCWRSESKPIKIKNFTWFINIKKYTKKLIFNLKEINWSKTVKKIQKKWINIKICFIRNIKFYSIYNLYYINIKNIKYINNLSILYLIIKKKLNFIFKKKIFINDKILKFKKKIIITNFEINFIKIKKEKINFLIYKKKFFFIKKTNINNWAFIRQRIWGSPFFYKKIKNNNFKSKNTIDTFFQSSWYYFYYLKSLNLTNKFKNEWFPINIYVGGIEHANLHLLYLRIMNNIFYDSNIINNKNVVLNLINQGFINNEVYFKIKNFKKIFCKKKKGSLLSGVEKMSKSKKNGINPIKIITKYGSDILKLSIISNKPIEKNINWKDINFSYIKKFILKINNLIKLNIINIKKIHNIKNIINIKKIHNIISYINKILIYNNSIKQIENIIFWLYPIIPNISKIFWFKIGNFFSIEKFKFKKKIFKEFKIYFKKKYIGFINKIEIKKITNKNIYLKKITFSMDETSILIN
ncbi:class I tRNA ligase family protein [Candidatus Carsonella ruddii]|uniref:leucine--tRNA ligase n=1 Tax=Carsonella ruddii TaxID=114186 RepID=A0A1U9RRK0_CARRU|nr:class I tRNA ligase family protein [Candidatus Carsonella ruddii]AQU89534.1 Leucyl-tRNA synthetase [Candidatus Carsonella ruddii]